MPQVRLLLAMGLLVGVVIFSLRYLPPEWDPRAPLDLRAEPSFMTEVKLWRLGHSPAACFAAFQVSGIGLTRMPDQPSEAGCVLENTVLLPSGARVAPRDPVVTCPLAAAWVLFERNTLQPAARQHLGAEVGQIRHLGAYNCRNIGHAADGRLSQHATANAIDVSAFVLRDGREIALVRAWDSGASEAAFLHAVRDGACRWFRTVLGPDYNAAHANHFHFDMGPWRACR